LLPFRSESLILPSPVKKLNRLKQKPIILHVTLYASEALSLTLREEQRLRVRRVFRPKREEEAGGWRRLHNEELHMYASSNTIMWSNQGGRDGWVMQHSWAR